MSSCPVCGESLKEDFGLVNCSSCGASVMLGMDSEVSVADEPPAVPEPLVEQTPAEPLFEEAVEATQAEELMSNPEPTSEIFEEELAEQEPAAEQELVEEEFLAEVPPAVPISDMSDVLAFANSEESSAAEGHLKFNLRISGIDTVDIKTGIKEVLLDSKLHLDPDLTMAKVESGELFLEGISAVKCAILVQRLKSLSLEIDWEQYAIQQA